MNRKILKRMAYLLMAMLLIGLMGGCGSPAPAPEPEPSDEPAEAPAEAPEAPRELTYLTMGTGGVAGVWYPVGGVMGAAMSNSDIVSVTVQSSAASIENIRTVGTDERELGFATGGLLVFAQQGIEMWEGEAYPELAGLANFLFMENQFLTRKGSGIESLNDLAGKRVGTGAPGSGDEVFARGMLTAIGVYDQLTPYQLSYAEQVTAFQDRQLDVIYGMAAAPTAAVLDAASQAEVIMLPVDGENREKVLELYPFFVEAEITTEQYSFLEANVPTVGSFTTMFTRMDIDEEVIYEAMKAMFADLETIQAAHPGMADFTPENAVMGMPIELHPGARRFYEEVGAL